MANTISSSIMPRIIGVARETLTENFSLLGSMSYDFGQAAGKLGQTVSVATAASLTAASVTAANTAPAPSAVTIGAKTVTLDQFFKTSFALSGTDTQNYDLNSAFMEQIREAVRGMLFKINATVWAKYTKIPYAVGNSGTGFFASNPDGLADADKVLTENLCPLSNRKAIVPLKDFQALLKLSEVQQANNFGSDDVIRRGVIGDVLGFEIHRDQQAPTHTVGTGVTSDPVASATAIGSTTVEITSDSGDVLDVNAGDLIEFGDGYSYAVQADATVGNSSTATITLDRGLEAALAGTENPALATTTCTYDADSLVAIAGRMDGFGIASRLPSREVMGYMPQGQHFPIVEPQTGYTLLLSVYPQYHQVSFELSSIWGVDVIDSRKLIRLLTYSS